MVAIILAEPEHPGNIGSVCRAMANFGYSELILINPKCDPLSQEARNLAKHAQKVLENARIADWDVLKEYGVVAATAGVLATDYNLHRSPLSPEQGVEKLLAVKSSAKHKGAALLFGRESLGLKNEELALADFVITIPTHRKYPSMNLSHSVTVMLYVLTQQKPFERFTPIPANEKNILVGQFDTLLNRLAFQTEHMRGTQKKLWRSIIGRAMLTRREAFALFGFLRAIDASQTLTPTSAKRQAVKRKQ